MNKELTEDEAWLQKVTAMNKLIRSELAEEGELVSHIAVIMDNVLDAADIPEKIDLVGRELYWSIQRFNKLCRVLREELEQRQGHLLNLEKRVLELEKQKRGRVSSYE